MLVTEGFYWARLTGSDTSWTVIEVLAPPAIFVRGTQAISVLGWDSELGLSSVLEWGPYLGKFPR